MLGNWDSIFNDSNGDGNYTSSSPDEETERTHNFANEIEDITTLPFAYDKAGNMTEQGLPAAATKHYVHDAWNRLVQVRIDAAVLGEYEYNALHWRSVKRSRTPGAGSLDEMRLMYYSANWQLLEERIDRSWTSGFTEDERAQTFWGKRYIDDAVARRRDRDVNGTYDNNFFYVTDAQFSTVAMVSASNARVVERITYDSYGKARHHFGGDVTGDGAATAAGDDAALVTTIGLGSNSIGQANYKAEQDLNRDGTISTADRTTLAALTGGADQAALASGLVSFTATGSGGSTVHGPDNPIAWDGYVFNAETGQYHVRFRWYDPVLGRWLEVDPIRALSGTANYHEYVLSSPTTLLDPTGLEPEGIAHPIPLFLGGSPDQLCIDWTADADAHTRQHDCLARELNGGVRNPAKMREAFAALTPAARRRLIIRSLIEAGIDPKVLTSQYVDAMFADCQPGVNRSHLRRPARVVMNSSGRIILGSLSAVFALIAGYEGALAAVDTLDTNPHCIQMLGHMKRAFSGATSPCEVDCSALLAGRESAEQCALEMAIAVSQAGLLSGAATWESFPRRYNELLEKCAAAQASCRSHITHPQPKSPQP